MSTPDLGTMLWWLAEHGWRPVVYPETPAPDARLVTAWVCYPMGAVHTWTSVRASDPAAAVRGLYLFALEHPNEPPAPPAPFKVPGTVDERSDEADPGECIGGFLGPVNCRWIEPPVAFSACGARPALFDALAAMARAAARALRGHSGVQA